MSLILEALRKSEAERQIGRAPGLLTPMARAQPTTSPRWPWLLLLIAAVAGGAAAAAWWFGHQAAERAATSAPAAQPASVATPTTATAAPSATAPSTPPSPSSTPPVAATNPIPTAGPADHPADPDFRSVERESLPLPAPAIAPPAPLPAPTSAAPASAAVDAAPETLASPEPTLDSDQPYVASLRTMGAAERETLPPLRLNMHVFSDEPQQRFVMIDGRRLSEGETVASGIVVTQIRRDGAVLDVRGRALLLERP